MTGEEGCTDSDSIHGIGTGRNWTASRMQLKDMFDRSDGALAASGGHSNVDPQLREIFGGRECCFSRFSDSMFSPNQLCLLRCKDRKYFEDAFKIYERGIKACMTNAATWITSDLTCFRSSHGLTSMTFGLPGKFLRPQKDIRWHARG